MFGRNVDAMHPELSTFVPGSVWLEVHEYESKHKGLKLCWSACSARAATPMVLPARDNTGMYGVGPSHEEIVITSNHVAMGTDQMMTYYVDRDEWECYKPGYLGAEDDRTFECGVPVWGY